MRRARACALGSVVLVTACVLHSSASDGQSCQTDADCTSTHCVHGTCTGSPCSCSGSCSQDGSPSSDCQSGWLCVYDPPDPITGFFGASGGSYCAPGCGVCPTHWTCAGGSTYCSYDASWSVPQVTIAGPATGQTGQALTFVANVTSPDDATITTYSWMFDEVGTPASSSDTTTYTFPAPGQYTVTAYVVDSNAQTGQGTLPVAICGAVSATCYGPDDCCASLTCQTDSTGTGSCH